MTAKATRPIEVIVARLCASSPASSPEYAEAVCQLIGWMRWPEDSKMATAIGSSLYIKYLAETIDSDEIAQRTLIEFTQSTQLKFLYDSNVAVELTSFKLQKEYLEYIANVVRFVISYGDKELSGAERASLGKAHYALREKFYGEEWNYSATTHDTIWKRYRISSAFIMADWFGDRRMLSIDPSVPNSCAFIGQVIGDRQRVVRFLSRAHWVQIQMKMRLDPAASRAYRQVRFPDSIQPLTVRRTPTNAAQHEIMKPYRSKMYG